MHISEEKLKEVLLSSDLVTEESFQSAKEEAMRLSQTILGVLVGRRDITEKYLTELLAPYFGAPIIDLKGEVIPDETLMLVPETYAKSKQLILFAYDAEGRTAKLAMIDPLDYEAVEFLRAKLGGVWIETYLTTPTSLHYGLKQYKKKVGA
ncbi:MAG: hypothetical protein HZA25_03395, partial [Candidatus Niyogibacteria bacterium]|nr:hypothetical protein [Candidatus Niyogibacteria bacterium]